jgi:hypothetical protein
MAFEKLTVSVTGVPAGTGPAGTPLTVRSEPWIASTVSSKLGGPLTAQPWTQTW